MPSCGHSHSTEGLDPPALLAKTGCWHSKTIVAEWHARVHRWRTKGMQSIDPDKVKLLLMMTMSIYFGGNDGIVSAQIAARPLPTHCALKCAVVFRTNLQRTQPNL